MDITTNIAVSPFYIFLLNILIKNIVYTFFQYPIRYINLNIWHIIFCYTLSFVAEYCNGGWQEYLHTAARGVFGLQPIFKYWRKKIE